MKKFLFVAGIAFSVALAVVIGVRVSPDAMAVVVGIVCGILATVPTLAVMAWVLRQRDRQMESQMNQYGQYPPIVVVNGQGQNGNHPPPGLTPGLSAGPRSFKVIGQENTETKGDALPPFWDDL